MVQWAHLTVNCESSISVYSYIFGYAFRSDHQQRQWTYLSYKARVVLRTCHAILFIIYELLLSSWISVPNLAFAVAFGRLCIFQATLLSVRSHVVPPNSSSHVSRPVFHASYLHFIPYACLHTLHSSFVPYILCNYIHVNSLDWWNCWIQILVSSLEVGISYVRGLAKRATPSVNDSFCQVPSLRKVLENMTEPPYQTNANEISIPRTRYPKHPSLRLPAIGA